MLALALLGLGTMCTALWLTLQTAWLRGQVAHQVAALLNQLLRGRFSIGSVEKIALPSVVIRDFEVRDQAGQLVLRVPRVVGTLEFAPLLRGDVVLSYARADGAWASLHAQGDSLAIADVFLPREAAAAAPEAPDERPFLFRIRKAEVRGGTAVTIPGGFEARAIAAQGELSYSDAYRMRLSSVSAATRDVRGLRAALRSREFRLQLGINEWSELKAQLTFGTDRIDVTLGARWTDAGFTYARAAMRATLTPEGLSANGLTGAGAALRRPIAARASASWEEHDQRLTLDADVSSAGGALELRAQRDRHTGHAELRTAQLDLARILTYAGMPSLRFELLLDTAEQPVGRSFALRARSLRYDADSIPDWTARGSFDQAGAHLTSLELPSWEAQRGQLQLNVQADYLGNVRASLDASLPRVAARSRLGQLSGMRSDALQLRARASYHVGSDQLQADATLRIANLQSGGAALARVKARLDARGRLLRPQLSAELEAQQLRLGSVRVDSLSASARGGPVHYALKATATARNARADADFTATLGANEQRVAGSAKLQGWLKQPLQLSLREARVRRDAIHIDDLRATAGTSVLAMEGSYGRTRPSDLHLRLEGLAFHLPLGAAPPADAPRPGLRGHVAAHLHLTGTSAQPDAELSLRSADLRFGERPLGELSLLASLQTRQQRANAKLWLTGAEGDTLQVSADATLPTTGSLTDRFDQAHYALEARADQNVSRLFAQLFPQREPVPDGSLALSAQLAGPWRRPLGQLTLRAARVAVPGEEPFDGRLELQLSEAQSRLAADLTDTRGQLASVDAEVHAQLWSVLEAAQHDQLRQLHARYGVHVAERRLSELPRLLRADLPIAVKLDAQLSTSPETAPSARIEAVARYLKQEADARCPAFAAPQLALSARVDENLLVTELRAHSADRKVLEASLVGPTPGWSQLAAGHLERGFKFALEARDLELASLPWLCTDWTGRVTGGVRGEELLSARPKLAGQLHVRRMRYADSSSSDISLGLRADRLGLSLVGLELRQADRRVVRAGGTLPWSWDGARRLSLRADQCRLQAELKQFPLADLAGAIPAIAQPSGHVSGDITLTGCEDLSGLRGSLALDQAGFTLKDPLLRAEGLSAQLKLAPQAIELHGLRLSDQGGVLKGHGRVQIEHGRLSQGKFTFRATEFPLRTDARVSGYLDGDVDVALNWSSVPHRVAVSLDKIAVRLPQRAPHESQPLARHADVTYVDMPAASAAQVVSAAGVPVELKLVTEQAFWVRSNELSAQLKLNLTILSGAEHAELRGTVNVVRGFLNLFSKGFDIERGTLVFDGSQRIDPTVSLDAVHKLSDGQTVTVHVRDRLSAPVVTFSTSVAGITSDAEILQMLVRGREATAAQTAQAQVGAALAGMTSELLGSLANTRVGKYVPVLSLEAGASSGTRIRAGVEANSLIPPKLRNVVEGVYVEGFVGSKNQGGNATATGGVLMELYFPKDLVTGGTWELPNNWNVELTWEP